MADLRLNASLYLGATSMGAYYMARDDHPEPARRLLLEVLCRESSPSAELGSMAAWCGLSEDDTLRLLQRMQSLEWVIGLEQPYIAEHGTMEGRMPQLLAELSEDGNVLLADAQGLYLGTHGFAHEVAESISAVSADLGSLYDRHKRVLRNSLGLQEQAWGLVESSGNSQLGFWPLYIGRLRLTLAIEGRPRFNQKAYLELVGLLARRYAVDNSW
ncbi:MAG: hypothetical protein KDH88_04090 [Chromatiales bacterium]|nr:hypothetical protein [Chromatiales bacterium]